MSTIKSYPHYTINVKDNSIYNFTVEEVLPVHRAVWVLPTQEGPENEPIWVSNYTQFTRIFGASTLDPAVPNWRSSVGFWLRQLLTYNGAFIVRAVPAIEYNEDGSVKTANCAKKAGVVLYARVESNIATPKYLTDDYGKRIYTTLDRTTYATKAPEGDPAIDADDCTTEANFGSPAVSVASVGEGIPYIKYYDAEGTLRYIKCGNAWYQQTWNATTQRYDSVAINGEPTDDVTAYKAEERCYFEVTPETNTGLRIVFYTKTLTDDQLEAMEDGVGVENAMAVMKDGEVVENEYPILAVAAQYVGAYGNDLAFRFFNKASENSPQQTGAAKTVFNSFSAYRREFGKSTWNPIYDRFNRVYTTFSADPNYSDSETGQAKDMETILETCYDTDGEYSDPLPFLIYSFEENLNKIGQLIYDTEKTGETVTMTDDNNNTVTEFVADYVPVDYTSAGYSTPAEFDKAVTEGKINVGYMIDVLGGKDYDGNPFKNVYYSTDKIEKCEPFFVVLDGDNVVANAETLSANLEDGTLPVAKPVQLDDDAFKPFKEDADAAVVKPNANFNIMLRGGSDGDIHLKNGVGKDDPTLGVDPSFLDKAMYDFVKLSLNRDIVDKFRYPITHIYDVGYSMTTKFAMIDFLDVRDDVGVELTTQVLLSNEWATGFNVPAKLNDEAADTMNGIALREHALLMRESVLKNTDCMRCSIYTQTGTAIDPSGIGYSKDPVPFLFWSAYQHARLENTSVMSKEEPRGLPGSYNSLFKSWKWMPHSEPAKEHTWNAGLNYCQHADRKRIFYPSLRTVYRYDTSILCDQWDVDAIIYTKHECRKAWAKFVGRNDRVADLQKAIKMYLQDTLQALYNGKFDFVVEVYQTEEEKKIGYIQHVRLELTFPATMRVMVFDIEVNREGYSAE